MKKKAEEIEAKVKAALKFIGRTETLVNLCGHRYNFGGMKRAYNQVEYDTRSGKIRVRGSDPWNRKGRPRVNLVLGKKSPYRAEALRAIFNGLIPEVRRVGLRKMERDRLNSYLRSKKVPLSC
jgi:hypothetical protein